MIYRDINILLDDFTFEFIIRKLYIDNFIESKLPSYGIYLV